ncbi:hypothetical protein GCM10029978_099210 [Actinoallomurus acanthiterrae]
MCGRPLPARVVGVDDSAGADGSDPLVGEPTGVVDSPGEADGVAAPPALVAVVPHPPSSSAAARIKAGVR